MIEQAMIFALGALTAGLVALISLPAFWRRAMRLSRRRLELQLPLSATEFLAERDQARAEAALALRQAEQKLEAAQATRARDLLELGRRAVALDAALRDIAARAETIAGLEADLSASRAEATGAAAEGGALAQALQATTGLRDAALERLADLERRHADLDRLAESRRGAIAALETRTHGLEMRIEDLDGRLREARATIETQQRESAALAEERNFLARELSRSEAHLEKLQARFAAQAERLQQAESESAEARAATRRADLEAGQRREALAREAERIAALEARVAEHRRRFDDSLAGGRARERDLADRIEALRAEKAALDGALAAARAERDALRAELAGAGPRRARQAGEEELRRLITQVADEVVRQSAAADGPGSPAHDWLAAAAPPPRRARAAGRHAARLARAARLDDSKSDPATGL